MNSIKGIIFDVDGVLIDSENIHYFAYREVLKNYNFELTREGYKKWFSGRSIEGGAYSFVADNDISLESDDFKNKKLLLTKQIFCKKLAFYDDTLDFIRGVNKRAIKINNLKFSKKLKLGLATGLEKVLIREMFKLRPDLEKFFSVIITAGDYSRSKPNPECYLKAARKIKIAPESLAGVEDSPSGIEALNNANIFSIAITTTHSKEELKKADLIMDSLTELFA